VKPSAGLEPATPSLPWGPAHLRNVRYRAKVQLTQPPQGRRRCAPFGTPRYRVSTFAAVVTSDAASRHSAIPIRHGLKHLEARFAVITTSISSRALDREPATVVDQPHVGDLNRRVPACYVDDQVVPRLGGHALAIGLDLERGVVGAELLRHGPILRAGEEYGAPMKFHATVVFEFNAHDVAEAGERLSALLEQATAAKLDSKSIELATGPGTLVTLPQVTPAA
jgi:hypothetical protein